MTTVIKSGRDGNTADVDDLNRLKTFSISESVAVNSARAGQAFLLSHPPVQLTSDNESFIFYGKNNDTVPWIVSEINTNVGLSNGTGELLSRIIIDGSTGTLITGGTSVPPVNLNINNPQILPATLLYGVEGSTVTNGTSLYPTIIPHDSIEDKFNGAPIIVPPNTSFSYAVTPPAGNTSVNVQLTAIIYRDLEV